MGSLKNLAGQTAIYGISSILGKTINFLLIPLYTGYLDKETLGSFTVIYALIAFLNVVFTYGMETAYFRFSTGKDLDPKRVYNNVQTLISGSSLLLGCILYFSAAPIADLFDYPDKPYLFRWAALILTIDALLAIPYAKLRIENKAMTFALTKLLNILLNVGFNLFFIVLCYHIYKGDILSAFQPAILSFYRPDWGVDYILLSNLLANFLIVPVLIYHAGKFSLLLEKNILLPMWHYALPLLFMGLAGVTNEVFSRGLFEYALPENFYEGLTKREAGGVFGANFKLAILMNLIIQAFKYAAEPFFFQESKNRNNPEVFARVMHWFVIFCATLMVMVSVNLDIIGPLFLRGDGYETGLHIVPILLSGYLFLGIYYNLSIWFKITDQTKYSFYITLTGSVITILVILTLVPVWGFTGAALSTLLCYLTMSIICYYIGQKYYPIPYQTGKALIYLGIAFAFSFAGFLINTENQLVNLAIHNSFVAAFIFLVAILEKKELYLIQKTLRRQ